MATFRSHKTRVSDKSMGRAPTSRKPALCSRHGKLCACGSDWAIFLANLRWRSAFAIDSAPGFHRLRRLSEANARSQANDFWNYLWDPFLDISKARSSGFRARGDPRSDHAGRVAAGLHPYSANLPQALFCQARQASDRNPPEMGPTDFRG